MPKGEKKIIIEVDENELLEQENKKETVRVLSFSLGGEGYCIKIAQAKEVIKSPPVTKVPNTPQFVVGVINLRGEIISVVDIRYFFGLEQKEKTKDIRVIISDAAGSPVGIIIDKIKDTINIEKESIQPPLSTIKGKLAEYTEGQVQLKKEILTLLDLEKVLRCEEMENLRKGGV